MSQPPKQETDVDPETDAEAIKRMLSSASVHFMGASIIRDKDGKLARPQPSVLQHAMYEAYEHCLEEGIPARIIVLKARQVYGSTAAAHICYHHTRRFKVNGLVMADDVARTQGLWDIICRFADCDRVAAKWGSRWHATAERATISFEQDGQAATHVFARETASDPKAGAAGTWQTIWFSEAARYPKSGVAQDTVVIGNAINAMPPRPNTLAILESTAEGQVGYFADTYAGAVTLEARVAGNAGNGWIKIFCPWHHCTDYSLTRTPSTQSWFDHTDPRFANLRPREEVGRIRFGWSAEQIAWRRMKILSELNGDEHLFDRDFPESEEAAFGASGSAALDAEGLQALRAMSQNVEPMYGDIVSSTAHKSALFAPTTREQGSVWIWDQPVVGARYLVAVDPMSGKSDITGSGEKDRNSVLVLRDAMLQPGGLLVPPKLVARIAPPNQWDDKVIARWIALLSLYYGGAIVVVEANCGGGIIEELRDSYATPLLHRPEFNKTTQRQETRLGWWTDKISRRIMISELQDHVRERKIHIPCRHTVAELASLIIDHDGQVRAPGRHHDDDALALAMALACLRSSTLYRDHRRVSHPRPVDHYRWKPVPAWT
jgi:hypothetical protein